MTKERRFHAGWQEEVGGVWWRAIEGRKTAGDLVLQVWVGEWVKVPMVVGFLLADFFGENEDNLYPPPFDGGDKYMRSVWKARHHGYRVPQSELDIEKAAKQQREQQEAEDGYAN